MTIEIWYKIFNIVAIIAAMSAFVSTVGLYFTGNILDNRTEERVAVTNERAAKLENETAHLKLELEREVQKRAARLLTEEQKTILTSELKGKMTKINILVQNDIETKRWALDFLIAFQDAGITLSQIDLAPGEVFSIPGEGVIMYRPGGFNDLNEVEKDPLYTALNKAGLYAGNVSLPFTSLKQLSLGSNLPDNEYAIYIGQKHPF